MSAAGGSPVNEAEAGVPIEWGICPVCGVEARGPLLGDLTAYTAAVEHCPPPNAPDPQPALPVLGSLVGPGRTAGAERDAMNNRSTPNGDPQQGTTVETFRGTHGEQLVARLAPMGLVVVSIDQVVAALPREEAVKLGQRILWLAGLEEEGGDR